MDTQNETRMTKEEQERDAEYHAGLLIAGQSALKKAAHEQYNSAEAQALRLQAEVGKLDPKAQAALDYLTEGADPGEVQNAEALVYKRAFLAKRQDAEKPAAAEPRADGLDVVAEQVKNAEPVDNPKLADPDAGGKTSTPAKAQVDVAPPGRKKAV